MTFCTLSAGAWNKITDFIYGIGICDPVSFEAYERGSHPDHTSIPYQQLLGKHPFLQFSNW